MTCSCDEVARAFHESYERLAPAYSYVTRKASAVPWDDVPENNTQLMRAVVHSLATQGIIEVDGVRSAADTHHTPSD